MLRFVAQRSAGLATIGAILGVSRPATNLASAPVIEAKPASVRLVTYNLLSPALAAPSHFTECDPADLDEQTRFDRLKRKLIAEMQNSSVICLQEVSRKWTGQLIVEFEKHGYTFACHGYGGDYSDYMGSGIAWPAGKYIARDVEIKRVSDTKKDWPKKLPAPSGFMHAIRRATSWLTGSKVSRPPFEPWQVARKRSNVAVLVRLQERGTQGEFCVATYHMPCLFGSDEKCQVMVIHAALLVEYAQKFAAGQPLVVAGDFNIKPHDACYGMIRDGTLPIEHPQMPSGPITWKCKPMQSAYAITGGEPEFTNFAKTKFDTKDGPSFCETLDYIWLSDQWAVASVLDLPPKDTLGGKKSFPSKEEPSDHIMLAAELRLGK